MYPDLQVEDASIASAGIAREGILVASYQSPARRSGRAPGLTPTYGLHSSPGILTEVVHLYLARGLRRAAHHHETHEIIEIHWLPFGQALDWCRDGTITDAKTLIGLSRTQATGGMSDE